MKPTIVLALGTLFLAGCPTPQQQAVRFEENFV
jgi:uncharacterized lipoprotein YajG